jgi:hypothetical protein
MRRKGISDVSGPGQYRGEYQVRRCEPEVRAGRFAPAYIRMGNRLGNPGRTSAIPSGTWSRGLDRRSHSLKVLQGGLHIVHVGVAQCT